MTDVPDFPEIMTASSADMARLHDIGTEHRRSSFLEQEEGVLKDVLEELDRERHKRAELEAQVRVLQEDLHSQRRKNSKSTKTSVRDYTLAVTERDGYKEILDALTEDRPAFSASAQRQKNGTPTTTLPIHIIRLLEVMPWDPRAQQYVFGFEQVYEWQIYSVDKKWQKELRHFPTFFKTLPIVVPTPGKTVAEASRSPFGSIAPPKQCVLTNLEATTILNIDRGYPLPDDGGGWTWVGPWKVEKNIDTDEQGWTYSNDAEIRTDPETYYNEFRLPEKGRPNIVKRRRKWTRLRVLIDYPHASKMTREYLKLVAEKATLEVNTDKLSGHLVETKMCLTDLQAEHLAYQERTNTRIRELERQVEEKNKILSLVEDGAGVKLTGESNGIASLPSGGMATSQEHKKLDQVAEIRSAVTQWVSNAVHKQQQRQQEVEASTADKNRNTDDDTLTNGSPTTTNTAAAHDAHDPKQQLLESLRDKGTGLFEILKQKGGQELDKIKQGGGGLPWQRKDGGGANTPDGSESIASAMNGDTNTSIHGTIAKLQTLESENTTSTASSDLL